jgi:hypothetical protein
MKIRPVEIAFLHVGGQTDWHDEAKSRSSQLRERVRKRQFLFQLLKYSTSRPIFFA